MDKACLKHFEEHKRKTNVTRLYLFFFCLFALPICNDVFYNFGSFL